MSTEPPDAPRPFRLKPTYAQAKRPAWSGLISIEPLSVYNYRGKRGVGDMQRPTSERDYIAADFDLGLGSPECDLILKGGLTSGVVYPYAILEIAKKYRLRSVGGTSVGAIAAGFAAAAEFARRSGCPQGFIRLQERCDALPARLSSLFQPDPALRVLYEAGFAMTKKDRKVLNVLWAVRGLIAVGAGLGAGIYLVLTWVIALAFNEPLWGASATPGLLIAILTGAAAWVAANLVVLVLVELPKRGFGLCSGLKQQEYSQPALTEWIDDCLQYIALGREGDRPLTFGDLKNPDPRDPPIDLRLMSTNLSTQQPEVIPRNTAPLLFAPSEWREFFPAAVIEWLLLVSDQDAVATGFRRLPDADGLPVVVGVRMSLSFPFLFKPIPLYQWDKCEGLRKSGDEPKQIWLSDGGISSNFPIHFFDALLPQRPTFGISLDKLLDPKDERVLMPQAAGDGALSPVYSIDSLVAFVSSILASATNWQDQMQSVLPGERQRVVRIRLKDDEGGLNLDLSAAKAATLMSYGLEAGEKICETFDFDEHRWRRTLVAYQQLDQLGTSLRTVWPDYASWYRAYIPNIKSYTNFPMPAREQIGERIGKVTDGTKAMLPHISAEFPQPQGRLRVVPDV